MKLAAALSLVLAMLATGQTTRVRHPQAPPPNDGGFTAKTETVSVPNGHGSMDYGIVVTFATNDPETIAFVGEVTYRVAGSAFEVRHVPAYCMRNMSGLGALYLMVGQAEDIHIDAWEVKALGRNVKQ